MKKCLSSLSLSKSWQHRRKEELAGICVETCCHGSALNLTWPLNSLDLMGSLGSMWLLYRAETPWELKTPKKKEGNCETGSTHGGLRRGHHGSAGSSSPIEEGKQILITSSTSGTKASEKRGQEGWQRGRNKLQQLMKAPHWGFSAH